MINIEYVLIITIKVAEEPVWQDGRYDEMIRSEEEFQNKWEYIRQNPVKAGLSKTPEEYPFLWETF